MTMNAKKSSFVTMLPDKARVTAKAKLPFEPPSVTAVKTEAVVGSWRNAPFMVADRESELRSYYYPRLRSLSDLELIAELFYQMSRVEGVLQQPPFRKGSVREVFVSKILSRRSSFFQGQRLSSEEWEQAFKACIYLWRIWMPLYPRPRLKAGLAPMRLELRQQRLKGVPDWELADRLASVVGACAMSEKELDFVGYFWLKVWKLGLEAWGISKDYERPRAERLLVEFSSRGRTVLYKDDITAFKCKVGFDPVPLGIAPEVRQLRLEL